MIIDKKFLLKMKWNIENIILIVITYLEMIQILVLSNIYGVDTPLKKWTKQSLNKGIQFWLWITHKELICR